GNFVGGVYGALKDGKPMDQALEAGRKAADEAFQPEAILTTAMITTAGTIAHPSEHGGAHEGGAHEGDAHEATSDPTAEPHQASPEPAADLQKQVERVTGVDKGPEHEQAMADLRDYYDQQNAEGQN